MSEQSLEELKQQNEAFKQKAIAKARRQHLKVEFPDGTSYDFRRRKPKESEQS